MSIFLVHDSHNLTELQNHLFQDRDQWHYLEHSNRTLACVHTEGLFRLFEHLLAREERNVLQSISCNVDRHGSSRSRYI